MTNPMSSVSFRIDSDVKYQAERLFSRLGLTMTTAFNIFLRQSIREGGLPFPITTTPAPEAMVAMLEAEKIARSPSTRRYGTESFAG